MPGEKLVFYKTPKLKKMKYIVLSATADTFIYKHYFGSDNVKAYECRQAKYLGSLKQYYDGSYSRTYIDTNDKSQSLLKLLPLLRQELSCLFYIQKIFI